MTSTTKNVIASASAATALVTGVIVATYNSNDNSIDWNSIIPNIEQYSPKIPDLGYDKILPKFELSYENLTVDKGESLFSMTPTLEVDSLTETLVSSHFVENISDSLFEEDDIVVYDKSFYGNKSLYESNSNLAKVTFSLPNSEKFELIMSFEDYNLDLINQAIKWKKIQKYFSDKRNVEHDTTILTNKYIKDWINIYDTYNNVKIKKIPLKNSFRMISEIKVPKNMKQFEILEKNLKYYQSRGYDSALIVFDGSESPQDLNNLVKYVRYLNLRPFFAFGGDENLSISVFVNPEMLKRQLESLSEYSEGFLLGWRRTSAHLFEQDIQYMNYMSECVRNSNKNCLIFGEIYYGNTAKYPKENKWGFGYNLPNYASAAVICNFGFESVNADGVIKYLIPKKLGKQIDKIALVVGQKPYYLTVHKNNLTQEKNQEIKEKIENRFIKAGCKGTITLHDDGRNGIGRYQTNNNLSETLYSSLK